MLISRETNSELHVSWRDVTFNLKTREFRREQLASYLVRRCSGPDQSGAFRRRYPLRLTILLGGRQAELFHVGQLIPEHPKWGTRDHSLLETIIMSNLVSEDPESIAHCFNLISEFSSPSSECRSDLML
jgi:hypothetical protein